MSLFKQMAFWLCPAIVDELAALRDEITEWKRLARTLQAQIDTLSGVNEQLRWQLMGDDL